MSATVNQKVEELITLLKDYANKKGDEPFEASGKPENIQYPEIVKNVKQWFAPGQDILYKDIKEKYKANHLKPPSIKDINIAFVDSNDYCISNTGNKYILIPLNDNNREFQRKAHWQLLNTTIKDKEGRGMLVDGELKQLIEQCKHAPKYKNLAKINARRAVLRMPNNENNQEEDENKDLDLDDKDPTQVDNAQEMIDNAAEIKKVNDEKTVAEAIESGEKDAPEMDQFK